MLEYIRHNGLIAKDFNFNNVNFINLLLLHRALHFERVISVPSRSVVRSDRCGSFMSSMLYVQRFREIESPPAPKSRFETAGWNPHGCALQLQGRRLGEPAATPVPMEVGTCESPAVQPRFFFAARPGCAHIKDAPVLLFGLGRGDTDGWTTPGRTA